MTLKFLIKNAINWPIIKWKSLNTFNSIFLIPHSSLKGFSMAQFSFEYNLHFHVENISFLPVFSSRSRNMLGLRLFRCWIVNFSFSLVPSPSLYTQRPQLVHCQDRNKLMFCAGHCSPPVCSTTVASRLMIAVIDSLKKLHIRSTVYEMCWIPPMLNTSILI
jgi:hypothetical protein